MITVGKCDADGCDRIGTLNPEILILHKGPPEMQNPLRVPLRIDLDKPSERKLLICDLHSRFPKYVFTQKIDPVTFLREVICNGQTFDLTRLVRNVGVQFVRTMPDGHEETIAHQDNTGELAGHTVHDGGLVA